ncbi:MAG: hypothetical protein KDG50_04880 [Chromatiales bacterium]|nr:hypothetical protein [Chromatiales bacterium]
MSELVCCFQGPVIARTFACRHAEEVAARNGPAVLCHDPAAHARCARLLARLKDVGLPALGCEDDLLSMPASAMVRVQAGGVLAIQGALAPQAAAQTTVADVAGLLTDEDAIATVADASIARRIVAYKVERRRGRH